MSGLLERMRSKTPPADLEFLFKGQTGMEWSYSPQEERYYSFREGGIHSYIAGKYVPDPRRLPSPTQDTIKLFYDWKSRANPN